MTQLVTIPFGKFLAYYGDGGDPENFTQLPMAMNSRGFSRDVKSNNITVPDFANEDALVYEQAIPSTVTAQLTGKGTVGSAQAPIWEAFIGVVEDYKIAMTDSTGATVGHWIGPMILSKYSITAARANVCESDVQFDTAGAVVWTAGS